MNLSISAASLAGAIVLSLGGMSEAQEPDPTRADYYKVGEEFAHCSAHFAFASEIARRNGLEDTAVSFEGMERGWMVAGLFFLVEGLDPSRQTEAQATFANLQQIEVERLRADREVAEAAGDTDYDSRPAERFNEQCGRWVELQQSVIRELRSGPAN